ncbi:PREDICTED: vesicle-associated protein 2-2 isoform X2 [Tarenaya hassleriana]|uniref:vesicle-associated protein 2-2 isoform X2 n=1 Tax=Tarenaya hassleriana TaxID=28532 RepID=UPI00053C272E|nr:PREDICTED: vesicle-associated protein 2-2 isoform X2 [Tarenaya hassleriana]XP_010531831.1 PREDICTED: vesicle-associated protein 2-2 isoform X2 [Tarenaya hassleriana]XP_010531832.1 PREDICTED: vesicle-associated protein 2-2 isoform X2 [Tarenaya hassleriana]XP_010531833.1 PREDICTED: vesicle-associated protein 2-2 isoform X2 [Tarenaya hassleriana]XP_010531834.1 PREDICTED: vesicle-associated protein 2-2 isoform X2 [Tarenaya hassleriana]
MGRGVEKGSDTRRVELKKQSSCVVQLTNAIHHYVAFKIKTTSPKKYCVRPNVGIVAPNSSYEFTVIMQAFKEAPLDMVCKDKFLIQSTIVPAGTTDEDITASMFAKEEGKHVEENKLRVTLVSASDSFELSPNNGTLKQDLVFEDSIFKDRVFSQPETLDPPQIEGEIDKEPRMVRHEETKPTKIIADDVKELKPPKKSSVSFTDELDPARSSYDTSKLLKESDFDQLRSHEDADFTRDIKPRINIEFPRKPAVDSPEDLRHASEINSATEPFESKMTKDRDREFTRQNIKSTDELKLVKDIEEMKLKANALESKLKQADATITKLIEEGTLSSQNRQSLQHELAELRRKKVIKQANVGFPLLFVCVVAFISIVIGYRLHP